MHTSLRKKMHILTFEPTADNIDIYNSLKHNSLYQKRKTLLIQKTKTKQTHTHTHTHTPTPT